MNPYLPQVEGLRAYAVLMVAVAHWVPVLEQRGIPAGTAGVLLFFALSGFLITRVLLRRRQTPLGPALKTFYLRRVLRIAPVYFLVVFTGLAAGSDLFWEGAPFLLTFTANLWMFAEQSWPGALSHFWTLGVEEQFYLVWPLAMLWLPRRWLVPFISVCILFAIGFRSGLYAAVPSVRMVGVLPVACLDALGAGALLAVLRADAPVRAQRMAAWMGGVGAAIVLVLLAFAQVQTLPLWLAKVRVTGLGFLSAWLVWQAVEGRDDLLGRALSAPAIRYLGRISYGFYLVHNLSPIVVHRVVEALTLPAGVGVVLNLVLTVFVSVCLWEFVDKPLSHLKSRIPYAGA